MKKFIITFAAVIGLTGAVFATWYVSKPREAATAAYKIGILQRGSFYEPAVTAYKKKMADLGYIEGKNVIYDLRIVSTKDEITSAVREFLKHNVDLIHTYSTPATVAAYEETKKMEHPTPIVFGSVGDPIAAGVAKSSLQSGTNVTGVVSLSTELTAKRIELLRKMRPSVKRIAMPHTALEAGDAAAAKSVEIAEETARKYGIELVQFPVEKAEDNAGAAKNITAKIADGIIVGGDSLVWGGIGEYIKQAIAEKIPFAAFDISQVEKGALVGFGPDYAVSGEQSAAITHQILRGGDPATIPLEVPNKLLLIVNIDTARKIGMTLDPSFLKEADVIIGGQ